MKEPIPVSLVKDNQKESIDKVNRSIVTATEIVYLGKLLLLALLLMLLYWPVNYYLVKDAWGIKDNYSSYLVYKNEEKTRVLQLLSRLDSLSQHIEPKINNQIKGYILETEKKEKKSYEYIDYTLKKQNNHNQYSDVKLKSAWDLIEDSKPLKEWSTLDLIKHLKNPCCGVKDPYSSFKWHRCTIEQVLDELKVLKILGFDDYDAQYLMDYRHLNHNVHRLTPDQVFRRYELNMEEASSRAKSELLTSYLIIYAILVFGRYSFLSIKWIRKHGFN